MNSTSNKVDDLFFFCKTDPIQLANETFKSLASVNFLNSYYKDDSVPVNFNKGCG